MDPSKIFSFIDFTLKTYLNLNSLGTVVRISAPTERPPYIICETPSQTAYGSYPVKITLDGTSWSWEYVLYTYPQTSSCTPPCSSNGTNQIYLFSNFFF